MGLALDNFIRMTLGAVLMLLGTFISTYITSWWIVYPSLEDENPVRKYFPPYLQLVIGPIGLLLFLQTGVVIWISLARSKAVKKPENTINKETTDSQKKLN